MTLFLKQFIGQNQFKSSMFSGVVILVILLSLVQLNEGQFFTKSSKSIPRMGRRSVSQEAGGYPTNELLPAAASQELSPYRRSLIEALVDEYGPGLVANLQKSKALAKAQQMDSNAEMRDVDGEIFFSNDQPLNAATPGDDYMVVPRDVRSPPPPPPAQQQPPPQQQIQYAADQRSWQRQQVRGGHNKNNQDLSLALRALNARRYLQQLASEQPQGGVFASRQPKPQQQMDKLSAAEQQQQHQID